MKTRFLAYPLLFLLLFGGAAHLRAQTEEATIFDEAVVLYNYSMYGGAFLHTNGWGAHFTYGINKTAFKSRILQLDIAAMKHPKEIKSYNPQWDDTRGFVFGKLNTFTVVRPSIGTKVVKFDKIRKSGVAIGYNWRVGPTLGFTKPVFLEILVPRRSGELTNTVVVEKYDPERHTVETILGRAGGLRGFEQIKIHPGLHAGFGLNFEYAPDREGIKGLEVGAVVDYFPLSEVEIMAFSDNPRVFFNLYIALQFGKRFNR